MTDEAKELVAGLRDTGTIVTLSWRGWVADLIETIAAENERLRKGLEFSVLMTAANIGLEKWKSKDHNAKWWRKIDGTPIPNDLLVSVCEEIARSALEEKP